MSRSSRRYKSLQQTNGGGGGGGSFPGCDRVRMPRARVLLLCLLGVLVLAVVLGVYLSNDTADGHVNRMPAADLTKDRVRERTRCINTGCKTSQQCSLSLKYNITQKDCVALSGCLCYYISW